MVTTKKQTAATPNRSQSPVPAKSKPPEKQNSQTVGSNNGAKSKPQPNLSSEQLAVELVKQIRNTILCHSEPLTEFTIERSKGSASKANNLKPLQHSYKP